MSQSTLMHSINSLPIPFDANEEVEIIHINIPSLHSLESLQLKLQEYQSKGYESIKFIKSNEESQTVELCKKRNVDEVVEYRWYRVNHKILRWLKDGLSRLNLVIKEKELGIEKYREKIKLLEDKKKPIHSSMIEKFNKKKDRLSYYKKKAMEINHIIDYYEEYTYEELNEFPNTFFNLGGSLK